MKRLALLLGIVVACGHHQPKDAQPTSLADTLRAKYAGWLAELKDKSGLGGWPSATDCDATLWAGEALAGGATVDLKLAEYSHGEIHRRPAASGECFPDGSSSTVSQDMLMGYMLGLWKAKDGDGLARLAEYGEQHNWVMGKPFPEEPRVLLEPSGQGLLGRAVEKLGGPKKTYSLLPEVCLPTARDFERHLQTIGILFGGDVKGAVSTACLDMLKANAGGDPADGLFAAALGVYSGDEGPALALLTADAYSCPSYVRGADAYCLVHKIFAAKTALDRF